MNSILLFLGSLGMQELLLIGLVILVFFGARKIPEFMKGLGKGVREFKDGIKEVSSDRESAPKSSKPTAATPEDEDRRD
ncbi:MAG: twin-arginine translocase TatA/TatE family subunit [Bacteroidota bacterium]|nr:twin-arginine translocase TatA/TatE family subunit [Bacteroidota bacterium]